MAFTDTQAKALKSKLRHQHVRTRESSGSTLTYVEGWHVISEANRIFGFDAWDRHTQTPECLWSELQRGQTTCFYVSKVRVTVRAGGTVSVRDGIGTGIGRSTSPEQAHEIAVKAAETDATKRALATFGNPFGLALYDREHHNVTKPRGRARPSEVEGAVPPLVLADLEGGNREFADLEAFAEAVMEQVARLETIEAVYEFWSANLVALTTLKERRSGQAGDHVGRIIGALKARLREVGLTTARRDTARLPAGGAEGRALLIPKERRLRDRDHLAFVANQPCLVCGRRPAQAHHLKFAQPRSMALKVSDEYTVPLCNIHHDELHRSGDERAWWARRGIIEPMKFAARLWAASRNDVSDRDDATADAPHVNGGVRREPKDVAADSGPSERNAG